MRLFAGMIRKEDYERSRTAMVETSHSPETYEEYVRIVNRNVDAMRLGGAEVKIVTYGLDEFLDFCKAQGLKPDGSARAIFAGVIGEGVMKAPWPKLVMPWNPSSSEIH